ncbi:MAG: PorT family protein [Bacteroidetes bacterium]|nr:PorT family protein [Bacteroidota bacterium]
MDTRKITLALAALLLTTFSFAQSGLRAGLSHSSFNKDDNSQFEDGNIYPGFYLGGFYTVSMADVFGIELGLNLATRGANFNGALADDFFRYRTAYLDVPAVAKLKFGPMSVHGGVYGGMALMGTWETKILGIEASGDISFEDNAASWSRIDYGYVFGAGFELSDGFEIEARLMDGLAKITHKDNPLEINNFSVQVGIHLSL